nr:MAG TPA: hypothetical protein [Caudoviricetes sp.]
MKVYRGTNKDISQFSWVRYILRISLFKKFCRLSNNQYQRVCGLTFVLYFYENKHYKIDMRLSSLM